MCRTISNLKRVGVLKKLVGTEPRTFYFVTNFVQIHSSWFFRDIIASSCEPSMPIVCVNMPGSLVRFYRAFLWVVLIQRDEFFMVES